jgi:nucleotide-binding universal stress UspA family protein
MAKRKKHLYLVAIDGSPASERALERAIELAKVARARLSLITVRNIPPIEAPGVAGAAALVVSFPDMAEAEHQLLSTAATQATTAGVEVAEAVSEVGDAVTKIVKKAEDDHADLVIVGSHGRKGFPRALLGSVAEKVVRNAPCSVLVVR